MSGLRRARRAALPLGLALALLGCPGPEPASCPATPYSGVASGTVVVRNETGPEWTDGASVPLVLGPQGGFMITPVLEIDGALAAGETVCLRVMIEHVATDGSTAFDEFRVRETNEIFRRSATGTLVSDVLFDQVRWSLVPAGTSMDLLVTVRGEDFAVTRMVTVLLAPT